MVTRHPSPRLTRLPSPAPDDVAGRTLRSRGDTQLRGEGGRPLAAADVKDGGPPEAGQCLCGLLQDIRAGWY